MEKKYVTKQFEAKTIRQKIFQTYWYLQLFYGRATSYYAIPLNFVESFMLIMVFLKVWFGFHNTMLIVICSIGVFVMLMLVGYIDFKYQIINEHTSFTNRFSPELQYIRRHVKK